MVKNQEDVKRYRCPSCFAKEVDVYLSWDKKEMEYYCQKCNYVGNLEDIEAFFNQIKRSKYKGIYRDEIK